VRCPGHTIQFLGYGYSKYIEKTLKLLGYWVVPMVMVFANTFANKLYSTTQHPLAQPHTNYGFCLNQTGQNPIWG